MNDRYEFYKSKGICVQCGQKDAFPGHTKCPECIEKAYLASRKCWDDKEKAKKYNKKGSKRRRRIYQDRKEKGVCVNCGSPVKQGVYCERCREKRNAKRREGRKEVGEAFRERIAAGVCMYCGGGVVPGYKLCEACLNRRRELNRRSNQKSSEKWRGEIANEWKAKKKRSGNG